MRFHFRYPFIYVTATLCLSTACQCRKFSSEQKVEELYLRGRQEQEAGNYVGSSFFQAETWAKQCKDSSILPYVYLGLAENYCQTYQFKEELSYAGKAIRASQNDAVLKEATFRYATALAHNKQYLPALKMWEHLETDSIWRVPSLLSQNYYKTLLSLSPENVLLDNYLRLLADRVQFHPEDSCAFAYLLGVSGKQESADSIFRNIRTHHADCIGIALSWESSLAEKIGDSLHAYSLLKASVAQQDSIVRETLQQSLLQTQKEYYKTLWERTEQEKETKKIKTRYALSIAVLLLFILIASCLFLWRRLQSEQRENQAKLKLLGESLKRMEENQSSWEQLRKEYLSRMFRPLGRLYGDYVFALQHGQNSDECKRHLLSALEDIRINKEDGWFEMVVNEESKGLLSQFKTDFPQIKADDFRLFCYYLAGFDATTISIICKIATPNAVYVRKNRLRKMIAASSVKRKEDYISVLL